MRAGCRRLGTCVRNCVGGCSLIHSDDEYGTDFLGTICSWVDTPPVPLLFKQFCCNGVFLRKFRSESDRQLEMEQVRMMSGCKSILSRKPKGTAKATTKTRKEIARRFQATRAIQTSTRATNVAELDIGRKIVGDQVEKSTTIPLVTTTHRKRRTTRKAKTNANK